MKDKLPEPRWIGSFEDATGMRNNHPFVGITTESIDGTVKDFLWWQNTEIGSLNDRQPRHVAAAFVTRYMLEHNVEVSFGPVLPGQELNLQVRVLPVFSWVR